MKEIQNGTSFDPQTLGDTPGWERIPCDKGATLFRKCDAAPSDFIGYDHAFAASGYTCLAQNDLEGNRTAVYGDEEAVYTLSWAPHEGICRLIVDPATARPDAPADTPIRCPVLVTQLRLLYGTADCGMGYLIRLADGRFVMIDCGVGEYDEAEHLLELLHTQNVRDTKPTIAAWFITHPHGDHFGTFVRLMENHGDQIRLEAVAYNWPTREMAGGFSDLSGFERVISNLRPTETKIITPRAGWTFVYPGVRFQVLFACEDLYPTPYRDINNSSLVMRMDVGEERTLWLGDCSGGASGYLCDRYTAETLRCRFLQVGHHGYWGGSDALYRTVAPEVLFWPCPDFWYQEITHWDCNRALAEMQENSPLVGSLSPSTKEEPKIQKIYVSGRQEVTVESGKPLPPAAPEIPSENLVILAEGFSTTSHFAKGWASITGGQTGYSPMRIDLQPGSGTFTAGERRALCELVRPDLMPDSYLVTMDILSMEIAALTGNMGLVCNHPKPTVWSDELYLPLAAAAAPCTVTLAVSAEAGKIQLWQGEMLLSEADYTPAEKHGLYLVAQNGSVTIGRILVENIAKSPFQFRQARQEEAAAIYTLYQSVQGGPFCTWNETYPGMQEVLQDLETGNLYVLTDGETIVGALSVVPENELDAFPNWKCGDGTQREIARVAVAKTHQGRNLSSRMVENVLKLLARDGCGSVHLSVAKQNLPAYRTYQKAGFEAVGEVDMYGNRYFLMEKTLS